MFFKGASMKNEKGRSLIEILGVIAIIGLLTTGGMSGYIYVMRQKMMDNIADTLKRKIVEIDLEKSNRRLRSSSQLEAFLEKHTTIIGSYKISFRLNPNNNNSIVSDITHKNGERIKGSFCRSLIKKMADQEFAEDVHFSLKDEVQEDGSAKDIDMSLNGKIVNLDDLCGG